METRGKDFWATLTADLQRYTGTQVKPWSFAFLKRTLAEAQANPGLLAVVNYRYGQWLHYQMHLPVVRQALKALHLVVGNAARLALQIDVPKETRIGPGFKIYHFGGVFLNDKLVAGRDLTVGIGVVVGCNDRDEAPVLGDGVTLNAGCKVIGGVTLGDGAVVGAGAVVVKSFGDGAVLGGVPAKQLHSAPRLAAMPA